MQLLKSIQSPLILGIFVRGTLKRQSQGLHVEAVRGETRQFPITAGSLRLCLQPQEASPCCPCSSEYLGSIQGEAAAGKDSNTSLIAGDCGAAQLATVFTRVHCPQFHPAGQSFHELIVSGGIINRDCIYVDIVFYSFRYLPFWPGFTRGCLGF